MRKVLIKDLVIPAGTVFVAAPTKTVRMPGEHVEAVIGLTKNTTGTVTYAVGDDQEALKEWFRDLIQ